MTVPSLKFGAVLFVTSLIAVIAAATNAETVPSSKTIAPKVRRADGIEITATNILQANKILVLLYALKESDELSGIASRLTLSLQEKWHSTGPYRGP